MTCQYKHAQDWTDADWVSVLSSFARHISESRSNGIPWARFADEYRALDSIIDGTVRAVIVDNYVLVYITGTDWYTTVPSLVEQMLIKLNPFGPSSFGSVLACLDALAAENGCKQIVTGNGVNRPGLARLYQGAGYVRANEFYLKEIP